MTTIEKAKTEEEQLDIRAQSDMHPQTLPTPEEEAIPEQEEVVQSPEKTTAEPRIVVKASRPG